MKLKLFSTWSRRQPTPPDPSSVLLSFDTLLCIVEHLGLHESLRVTPVCKAWLAVAKEACALWAQLSYDGLSYDAAVSHGCPLTAVSDNHGGVHPCFIAPIGGGVICASDTGNDRLTLLDSHSQSRRQLGLDGLVRKPKGVAVARDGKSIYVADLGRVQLLRLSDGAPLASSEAGVLERPHGLTLTTDGQLVLVSDLATHRVAVLGAERLDHRLSIGNASSEADELAFPCDVAEHAGILHVAEGARQRLGVFELGLPVRAGGGDSNGRLSYRHVRSIGCRGEAPRQFLRPFGLCALRERELLVVAEYYRLQLLSLDGFGTPLQLLPMDGLSIHRFDPFAVEASKQDGTYGAALNGVAMDEETGTLLVASSKRSRVHAVRLRVWS